MSQKECQGLGATQNQINNCLIYQIKINTASIAKSSKKNLKKLPP